MHRQIALLAIAASVFLAAACGSDETTAPSAAPLVFSALLSPANEVPPVGGSESAGHGAVQVQFDVTRDASGAITAATGTFYFQLTGYPAGTTLVGAHIHPAPAGVNGPVVISTGLTTANTVTVSNGTGEFTFRGVFSDPAIVQQIINNPAAFYFNVHSPTNPGGFSRGQLARVQ
jgi:CHRD domain-containing protein